MTLQPPSLPTASHSMGLTMHRATGALYTAVQKVITGSQLNLAKIEILSWITWVFTMYLWERCFLLGYKVFLTRSFISTSVLSRNYCWPVILLFILLTHYMFFFSLLFAFLFHHQWKPKKIDPLMHTRCKTWLYLNAVKILWYFSWFLSFSL